MFRFSYLLSVGNSISLLTFLNHHYGRHFTDSLICEIETWREEMRLLQDSSVTCDIWRLQTIFT